MRAVALLFILLFQLTAQGQFIDVTNFKNFSAAKVGLLYGSGVSSVDYDNDGDIDIFVCSGRGFPDYLYQNESGSFTSVAANLGLASMERSRMALWFDYDGDADLDLLVSGDCDLDPFHCVTEKQMHLYNQDNGTFTEVTEEAGLHPYGPYRKDQALGGLAAADINGDGFLDIVQTIWDGSIEVFINNKNGRFTERSKDLGLDKTHYSYWQPFFHDFNNDGYIDLYCNVDFAENQFWMNSAAGTFENISATANCNSAFNEMGISLGDIDNDGDFDIYATNIADWTHQARNILLQQEWLNGSLFFYEVSTQLGVDQGGWGWGTTFLDANNDGLIDLATTNGWAIEDTDQSKIWIQRTDGTFSNQSAALGFNDELNGVTLISLDYDRDGDLDMIQSIKGYEGEQVPIRLLENRIPSSDVGNYLVVKPRMNGTNHFAVGATVTAFADGNIYSRIIHAGTSYYGQEALEAYLGLGQHNMVDSLKVNWPGGEVSWWFDIAPNQIVTLNDDHVVHRPSGFQATEVDTDISLSWNDLSKTESGFKLQRSTSEDFATFTEFSIPTDAVSYLDTSVQPSTTYFYRLNAYNDEYVSRFTNVIEIVTEDEIIEETVLSFDNTSSQDLLIYPNPTSSVLNISSSKSIAAIKVFSMDGREVHPIKLEYQSTTSVQIDVQNLRQGIYFLKMNNEVKRIVIKK